MRTWLVALPMVALLPVAGLAVEAGVYDYRIHHSLHGDIGTHRMTVTREDGGRLRVEHEADIDVRLLSALLYYRDVQIHEIWEDERLTRFEALVDDDGAILKVAARREGDALVVDGDQGVIRLPAEAAPAQPSFEQAIDRSIFFAVETGEAFEAEIAGVEAEDVEIAGSALPATKYTLSGGREDRIWFADDGLWVKWELDEGGGVVTLTRE